MSETFPTPRPELLITGATGFLGAHVAAEAGRRGWRVLAGVRNSSNLSRLARLAPAAECVILDIDRPAAVLSSFGVSAVIHCAAYGVDYRQQDSTDAAHTNILGTMWLVEAAAAAGVKRFVHVGTAYEYGSSPVPLGEDAPTRPTGIYGSTKAAATILALERAEALGLALAVVRPFGMYGPLEGEHKLFPLLIRNCFEQTALELTAGEQRRDYAYVGDIADACVDLCEADAFPAGQVLNLGSGKPVTLRQLGEAVAVAVGRGGDCLRWGAMPYRPDEVMVIAADMSKTRALTGWEARTSLTEGLKHTLQFETEGMVSPLCGI